MSRIALVCFAGLTTGFAAMAQDREVDYFRVGTGSPAGTYFEVGELLSGVISVPPGAASCGPGGHCGVKGMIALAKDSAGSVANISGIAAGQYESVLAQANVVEAAFFGRGPFIDEPHPNIRVIASLYTESVHLVVSKDAAISSVVDLKGARVSVDTAQSGTYGDALLILDAFGIGRDQAEVVELDYEQASDRLAAGELDAYFLVTGFPSSGVAALAAKGGVDIVPITGEPVATLRKQQDYFVKSTIPAGTYEGIGEVTTLGIGAQWIARADHDEQRVYEIARALWHPTTREMLAKGHERAKDIQVETALQGVTIPIHAGALRYYLEAGILE